MGVKDRTGICFDATNQTATLDVWKQHFAACEDKYLNKKVIAPKAIFRSPSCGSLPGPGPS